jgi:hypothetical protein
MAVRLGELTQIKRHRGVRFESRLMEKRDQKSVEMNISQEMKNKWSQQAQQAAR